MVFPQLQLDVTIKSGFPEQQAKISEKISNFSQAIKATKGENSCNLIEL